MSTSTILQAQRHLADIHAQTSELWLAAREHGTVGADDQYGDVVYSISLLRSALDQLLDAEYHRDDDPSRDDPTRDPRRDLPGDDELDPSDPQRMTVANWPQEGSHEVP